MGTFRSLELLDACNAPPPGIVHKFIVRGSTCGMNSVPRTNTRSTLEALRFVVASCSKGCCAKQSEITSVFEAILQPGLNVTCGCPAKADRVESEIRKCGDSGKFDRHVTARYDVSRGVTGDKKGENLRQRNRSSFGKF